MYEGSTTAATDGYVTAPTGGNRISNMFMLVLMRRYLKTKQQVQCIFSDE